MSWVNLAFLRTRGKRFRGLTQDRQVRISWHWNPAAGRGHVLFFLERWFSMSYKTERGNVAKKSLRFHATAKIVLDYQLVTKCPVAASRHCTLTGAPGGDGASGGSLRSSRQAVAWHPFTRSWATMPPEAPPTPPAGLFCHVFFFCDPFRCHFLILVDSDWSRSLKWVYSGCSFFGSIFRGSFCTSKTF